METKMQKDYFVVIDNHCMLLLEYLTYITLLNVDKYLEPYTEQQEINWQKSKKIVVYKNMAQLCSFIKNAKERKNAGKKIYFGRIKHEVAERIKKATSYNVEGYNCALYSDNIRKIYKDHGDEQCEGLRGQRAIKDTDFFRIPEIISKPELIENAGLYNKNPVIHFKKDGITIVGIIADGSLDLYTQTMYINKKRSLATAIDERASINTP